MKTLGLNSVPARPNVRLVDAIGSTLIIAHKEDTHPLEQALTQNGFCCQVMRQASSGLENFSPSQRCLLNHAQAWKRAAAENQLTLVVEADFVPVVNFGQLPLPFDNTALDAGIAWLYTCAPQLYSVNANGYAQGFSTSMVAYVLTPEAATRLLEFCDRICALHSPESYICWDSQIDETLRQHGLKNYIPYRNYGEHGGLPNPEHRRNGLSAVHRADVLHGNLAFSPLYAANRLHFQWVRLKAQFKGIGRLLSGKYLRPKVVQHSSVPWRLVRFAIARYF